MANTFYQLRAHLVFSTQGRRQFITETIAPRLHAYLGGALRDEGVAPLCVGGYLDHVHLLIGFKPVHRLSDLVRTVKTNSSKWLNEQNASLHRFAWQRGYSIFSVSHSQVGVVRAYVANQVEHHARLTFEDELRLLLKRHGIEFDEEYLLD
ncbi:IS200/IS605 family transposase [Rubripirellula tenax]|nr:IS200/IS605 family transposase [Rubripirellula tenax]